MCCRPGRRWTRFCQGCLQAAILLSPSLLAGMAWYCMLLPGITWYCLVTLVSHSIAWYCVASKPAPPLTITAGRLLVMKKNEKEEEGSKIKVNFQENVYAEIVLIYSYVFFFIDLYFYQFYIRFEVSRDHMRRSTSQNKSGKRPVLVTFGASLNISKDLKPSCRLKSKNIAASLNISKQIKSFRLKSKMFDSHMPWGYNALFSGENDVSPQPCIKHSSCGCAIT